MPADDAGQPGSAAVVTSDALLARMKTLHPMMIDLSLERIERLLARLGHPERRLAPVIHIAGTNGKGSTTAYLKAMFEASGRRVHAYTSPHLVRFHERIELAGTGPGGRAAAISEALLVDVLARTAAVNADDPMTFFEITTAAAFQAFAEHPADVVLLEVGLGGRQDTTNVIARPALCVITPVSMDHADKLGDTVAKIAAEKAGILKRDVAAIIARQPPDAMAAIRARARAVQAPLITAGEDYDAFEQGGRMVFQSEDTLLDLPLPALIGPHQIENAGTAVAAALQVKSLGLTDAGIASGLTTVRWPARMQRLTTGPLTARLSPGTELWLDGGHNPAGGKVLAETIAGLDERAAKPACLVIGMMGLKDVAGFLAPFKGLVRRIVTVPIPGAHEAPHTPEALAAVAAGLGFSAEPSTSVPAALDRIAHQEQGPRRIVICGSLYLAGHVLALQEGLSGAS